MNKQLFLLLILTASFYNITTTSDEPLSLTTALPNRTLLHLTSECSICLETQDSKKKSLLRHSNAIILQCGHHMHKSCFNEWSSDKETPTCPLCRTEVTNPLMKWSKENTKIIRLYLKSFRAMHKKALKNKKIKNDPC